MYSLTSTCTENSFENSLQVNYFVILGDLTMSASSISSASSTKCYCEVEATMRYANTARNPGRPFLGCPKYNTQGLPYCKFFKWVDRDQMGELELREMTIQALLRKLKELEKKLLDVEKREIELEGRVVEIENKEAEIRLRRTQLPLSVWAFAFFVAFYLVVSK
ncbi:hypothetical protein I3842_Q071200 [Carya illinoinensis]|uniref:GRF-type domain-containing protein n=1 Tax=Carya illinoinensis TaxID=32201 RepID=A0A922A4S3_CARIL|nr:hypothetical protein I3842_Q071200 [Carya illinoinensis]